MFERPLYQASIVENIRPGHAIINVVFNGTMVSYELIPQDNACWKDFHVNRKSGLVTNKVRIYPCYTVFISIMLGTFNTELLKTEKKRTLHIVVIFQAAAGAGNCLITCLIKQNCGNSSGTH